MFIEFPVKEMNGYLVPINNKELPFEIKRILYIYNTPPNIVRGNHGNRHTNEIMICLNGRCQITLDTYVKKETYTLDKKNIGLFIPSYTWLTFQCSYDAIILVLCDTEFTSDDRISDYQEIKLHFTQKITPCEVHV